MCFLFSGAILMTLAFTRHDAKSTDNVQIKILNNSGKKK